MHSPLFRKYLIIKSFKIFFTYSFQFPYIVIKQTHIMGLLKNTIYDSKYNFLDHKSVSLDVKYIMIFSNKNISSPPISV